MQSKNEAQKRCGSVENLFGEPSAKKVNASDSGKLFDYYENQMKQNISNAFIALKRKTVANDQVISNLEKALNDATKKTNALEKKISDFDAMQYKKVCINCKKVVDQMVYCNSECLK